jgi:peptidoglycan/xylan/chitin deacetylase (PgdA/CDA1 family)
MVGALLATMGVLFPVAVKGESVAITFDDLPLNGILPPTTTRTQLVKHVLTILKQHQVPRV